MSSTRSETGKQQIQFSFVRDILYPGGSTLLTHPFRVALNLSPSYTSWRTTVLHTWPRLFNGMAVNVLRGTCSSGSQFYVKRFTQEYAGFSAGILAASMSGTAVASFVETRLIRKNNLSPHLIGQPSLWRFNTPLTLLYLTREFGFTMGVLTKKDLSPGAQNVTLALSAAFTASIHKLAVSEATRDFLPKGVTVPDFRDGVGFTLRAIAQGNHYTHPSFQVKYPHPDTAAKQVINFMGAACGWNVFRFRLLYLLTFREAYDHMPMLVEKAQGHFRLFIRDIKAPVQNNEEPRSTQRKTTL